MTSIVDTAVSDIVDYHGIAAPNAPRIGFFDSRGMTDEVARTALYDDARAAAAGLAHHGIRRGDRVVLLMPTSPDYLVVLLGCLLSGVAPCTVMAPSRPGDQESAGVRRVRAAVAAVRPVAVIAANLEILTAVPSGTPALTVADLRRHGRLDCARLGGVEPDTVHHIQLTSGSTSAPRAVVLTHANIAAHLSALHMAADIDPARDSVFGWLPLYHDMGLVQMLAALTARVGLDLMSPSSFVRDPLCWLRLMSARRSTLTAAPPFAYRAVADRFAADPDPDVDLSRLRQAYVGAEPIAVAVLRHFRDTFAPFGLSDDALVPCYGMAETVVATTIARAPQVPGESSFGRVRWLSFDGACLDERRLAVTANPANPTRTIVGCGQVLPGLELRLVDDSGHHVGDGRVGEIHVRGTSVMAGYLTPHGLDSPPDGWHHTGDLGLLHDNELFVVGRTKELLIVRGRNLPPYDVEAAIEEHPDVGTGASAVFSYTAEDVGTEPVIAVVESRSPHPEQIKNDIAMAVRQAFGLSLADVVVVPHGRIPRTSSGKRQRAALRNAYIVGDIR